jgi:hypothetical protein
VLQRDRGRERQPAACPDSNADSNRAEPGPSLTAAADQPGRGRRPMTTGPGRALNPRVRVSSPRRRTRDKALARRFSPVWSPFMSIVDGCVLLVCSGAVGIGWRPTDRTEHTGRRALPGRCFPSRSMHHVADRTVGVSGLRSRLGVVQPRSPDGTGGAGSRTAQPASGRCGRHGSARSSCASPAWRGGIRMRSI